MTRRGRPAGGGRAKAAESNPPGLGASKGKNGDRALSAGPAREVGNLAKPDNFSGNFF